MFMQHVRTNNNVECTHNNFKAVAGEYCKQSNIFTFIHFAFLIKMKTEADKIPMTAKILSQKYVETSEHRQTQMSY